MTTLIDHAVILDSYKNWKEATPELNSIERLGLWKRITGVWYIEAGLLEMSDEKADLIRSMSGEHGLTICKALAAKHGQ